MHEEPCNSGMSVHDEHHVAIEVLGAAVVQRALDRLPADRRAEYDGATALSWVRISTILMFFQGLAEETGRDIWDVHEEIVRHGIARTLTTVWRLLLRMTSDEAIVKRTPILYGKHFNIGRASAQIDAKGNGRMRVVDFPMIDDMSLHGLSVGIEAVLEFAGRANVRVRPRRTAQGADFELRWDP
ncbi:MAG: DUF2378 family protein [Myxococcales bacterium]|nr:DUF2378 family protein [Myxococcales bacterium]